MLPSLIAVGRGVPHVMTIVMVNILVGWSIIGWLDSMAWAAFSEPKGQPHEDVRLSPFLIFQAEELLAEEPERPTEASALSRAA